MNIESGKRYKVTFEGVATRNVDKYDAGYRGLTVAFPPSTRENVVVEEVKPPAMQFKTGDLVKHRGSGNVYLLVEGGAIMVKPRRRGDYAIGKYYSNTDVAADIYTSEYYDLMDVVVDNRASDW